MGILLLTSSFDVVGSLLVVTLADLYRLTATILGVRSKLYLALCLASSGFPSVLLGLMTPGCVTGGLGHFVTGSTRGNFGPTFLIGISGILLTPYFLLMATDRATPAGIT